MQDFVHQQYHAISTSMETFWPPVPYGTPEDSIKALCLEASKRGMKVGRIKDPLYKDSYFGITPPAFIPPFEAPDMLTSTFSALYYTVCIVY